MNILVVIDMQNDFITGSLGSQQACAIVDKVKAKIQKYRNEGDIVIFTMDTHNADYLNTREGNKLPVPHCIKETHGWQLHPDLDSEGSAIFEKGGFGSTELARYIAEMKNVRSIELVGLCTDICVISNAMIMKAEMPEISISVDASCCAGTSEAAHNNALMAMNMCQIDIL